MLAACGTAPDRGVHVPMKLGDVCRFMLMHDVVAWSHLRAWETAAMALAREMTTMVGEKVSCLLARGASGAPGARRTLSETMRRGAAEAQPGDRQVLPTRSTISARQIPNSATATPSIRRWGNEELSQMWRKTSPAITKLGLKYRMRTRAADTLTRSIYDAIIDQSRSNGRSGGGRVIARRKPGAVGIRMLEARVIR